MLSFFTPRLNILLGSAKICSPSLISAILAGQPAPISVGNKHICTEKYEVQAHIFGTPLSSIYPQNGTEQSPNPMIVHTKYFWICRSLEILILLETIKLG